MLKAGANALRLVLIQLYYISINTAYTHDRR